MHASHFFPSSLHTATALAHLSPISSTTFMYNEPYSSTSSKLYIYNKVVTAQPPSKSVSILRLRLCMYIYYNKLTKEWNGGYIYKLIMTYLAGLGLFHHLCSYFQSFTHLSWLAEAIIPVNGECASAAISPSCAWIEILWLSDKLHSSSVCIQTINQSYHMSCAKSVPSAINIPTCGYCISFTW